MAELPRDGRSQEIGRLAGRAIGIKLPKSWIEKELDGDSDFGIDYFMQLKNSDDYVAFSFYLQLKGTTVPSYSADTKYISYDFKVPTLKYYHQQEPLVMLAVVDLKGNEDKLWECPIYYIWLDEDWFSENKIKLDSQQTISIKIPTAHLLDQSLDIYNFYAKRVKEKFAVAELKKEIKSHTEDIVQSIDTLTEAISDKPIFLKAVESSGDEPWIENPKGEVPTLLKQCSDSLNSNRLVSASEILAQLDTVKSDFNPHEQAEYYFQEATMLSMQGNYLQANEKLKCSTELSDKDRYKLGYIESKFKLSQLPTEADLIKIIESLPIHDYRNAIVKAKCLALTGNATEALTLLKVNFPNKIVGQLIILTILDESEVIDEAIRNLDVASLKNDRDKYIFHLLVARRAFVKANSGSIAYGKIVPIQGPVNVNIEGMKEAYVNLIKAWSYAKRLGYPSDVTMLLDISPIIFGYFNRTEDLFYHFEQILSERPNHEDIIKTYSRLLFNKHQCEKVIELLNRISPDLDINDRGMLILSNYHLKRLRIALNILREQEDCFIEEQPENLAFIFCIGAEIAQELFEEELAEKYLEIVKKLDSGDALISISTFIRKANAEPANSTIYANDLYDDYIKLGKPINIAEQLFRYLDPRELMPATQIIELANNIMSGHDLYERDYFRLTQALITISDFDKALTIAERHIDKESFDPYWHIIKVVCLQKTGKLGLAYNEIKASIDENRFSSDHLKQYVHICLQFGLLTEVEEALVDLLNSSEQREERLSFLSNLISIYSSEKGFSDKLTKTVRRFGQLVNREDSTEEGQFLIYSLMSPKNDNSEEIAEFQQRLTNYSTKFPDSHILKQGTIDLDNGPEALLSSMHKMAGITEEQLTQWEQNKNKIRNGSLPVPFVMLERFLRDTRDLFTTWVLANNTPEEQLEFKLNQASQLEQSKFDSVMSEKKSLFIEDTSLLILSEIGVLDKFIGEVDELYILESTFERIGKNNHPIAGSIYNSIPQQILQTINEHKTKLRLISEDSDNPFDAIQKEIERSKSLFLTDDVNLLKFVAMGETSLISANSYNVVEYLFNQSIVTEEEKYTLVSNICSFGIHQPNMSIKLLADALTFFTGVINGIDYTETGFKNIFDKVFSAQRVKADVIQLFFRTLFSASENSKFQLNSDTLISLFRGILLRHPYKSLTSFTVFWFVYQCIITSVNFESELSTTSTKHVELWLSYKEIIFKIQDKELTTYDLLLSAINQVFLLSEKPRTLAYQNIKSCFTPLTDEAELFEKIYRDVAINYQLMGS
jgi:tetratricopeptide (TPR) repeat protein